MKDSVKYLRSTVWGSATSPLMGRQRKRQPLGRLAAVTPSGPIYSCSASAIFLSVSSALALLQELAARCSDKDARVTSSLAGRVSGRMALVAWTKTSAYVASTLLGLPAQGRLRFLRDTANYAFKQGNANGIEAVLAAAVNGAWPFIDRSELTSVVMAVSRLLRKSEFAATNTMAVIDVHTRRQSVFYPGDLIRFDPEDWLARRGITEATDFEARHGLKFPGRNGPRDMVGPDGKKLFDDGGDPSHGLLPSGPGHEFDSRGGLPTGPHDSSNDFGFGDVDAPGGLKVDLGKGPDLSGLPGQGSSDPFQDLISGFLGPGHGRGGVDLSGPFTNPGLTAMGPAEEQKYNGHMAVQIGTAIAAIGAFVAGGTVVGAAMVGFGAGVALAGAHFEAAEYQAPEASPPAPAEVEHIPGTHPMDWVYHGPYAPPPDQSKETTPPMSVWVPPPNKSDPTQPKNNDLYPDPDGTGSGGGHPTQLPDGEDGGGTPNTIYDGESGGGTPNTIFNGETTGGGTPNTIGVGSDSLHLWDEFGGGGTPNTIGMTARAIAVFGPGLDAFGPTQVGPNAFRA